MGNKFAIGLLLLLISLNVNSQFAGGNGTKDNPYLIRNYSHLDKVRNYLNTPDVYFRQEANIDLKSYGNWIPIGGYNATLPDNSNKFSGHYDGGGFIISNLTIDSPNINNVGLFGHVGHPINYPGSATSIKNVRLENIYIRGARGVGALVGRVTGNANTLIVFCKAVNGSVSGDAATGGLVGSNNSHLETPGGTDNPVINKCFSNIDVYFSGNGIDNQKFGGLVGCNQKGNTIDSYAHGKVIVNHTSGKKVERIGGLAGCADYNGRIINCYSSGLVFVKPGSAKFGGLVGNLGNNSTNNIGWVINSYWNIQTSGQNSSAGGIGVFNSKMREMETFEYWDFFNVWQMDIYAANGFPCIDFSKPDMITFYSPPIDNISGWRMISSPVQTTYTDLLGGFITQGFPESAYFEYNPNLLWFDESDPYSHNMGWKTVKRLNEQTIPGRGQFFYMYGNQPTDKNYFLDLPPVMSATGKEYFDGNNFEYNEFTFPLTYTPREVQHYLNNSEESFYDISIIEAGWNLLGNPGAYTLDWNSEGWQKENVDNTIYVWDPSANEYKYWNGTIGNLSNGHIAPFQGFWVKANNPGPALAFSKNAIVSDEKYSKTQKVPVPTIKIEISGIDDLKSTAFITLDQSALMGADPGDAYRLEPLSNTWLSVYTTSTLQSRLPLVINNIPFPTHVKMELPLYVKGKISGKSVSGKMNLNWYIQEGWPAGLGLVLYDHLNRKAISMMHHNEYAFDIQSDDLQIVPGMQANAINDFPFNIISTDINGPVLKSAKGNYQFSVAIVKGNVVEHPPYILKMSELMDNYPNPFNTSTTFRFSLPQTSKVLMELYDLYGKKIEIITDRQFEEGMHSVTWNNPGFPQGVYILRFNNLSNTVSKRIMISR
jgi:hypothetical protein